MKSRPYRIARYLTLAAVTAAAASWSTASYACTPEPYLSAVCILAWTRNDLRGYAPASGQLMSISQNSALFALLGTTYGGDGQSTFGLPDLRGRVPIGAGTGTDGITYALGQKAGSANITLNQTQMPAHTHPLSAVNLSSATATIDLSKATGASAALSGATFTVDTSKLTLRASATPAGTSAPTNAALAEAAGPANRLYTSTAPNVDMAAGTFGGSIAVSSSAVLPVTLPASVNVALGGTLPASVTGVTGGSTPVSVMQPYLAMYYFIATQGVFPSSN